MIVLRKGDEAQERWERCQVWEWKDIFNNSGFFLGLPFGQYT